MDITRSHGDVKVVVTGGGVHLGGINGSATVQVAGSMCNTWNLVFHGRCLIYFVNTIFI